MSILSKFLGSRSWSSSTKLRRPSDNSNDASEVGIGAVSQALSDVKAEHLLRDYIVNLYRELVAIGAISNQNNGAKLQHTNAITEEIMPIQENSGPTRCTPEYLGQELNQYEVPFYPQLGALSFTAPVAKILRQH